MTEKELISQLKTLKQIKPRKEWAVLLKLQILSEKRARVAIPAQKVGILDVLSSVFFQRKLAYAFTAILFLVVGFFGFMQYTSVDDQAVLKQSVVALSNGVSDLAKQGKTESVINEIKTSATELVKNLKTKSTDSAVMKEIAVSLKTLADVTGVDLSENQDVKDLYQTVVQSQISDLEQSTLTENQQQTLDEIKDLYNQGKYTEALEKILLINK